MTPFSDRDSTSPKYVPVIVSGVALVLMVIHLSIPALAIDGITLALLTAALLPWLGPLLKSIEFPGGLKLEFREFRREVAQSLVENKERVTALADRVEKLALAFSGAITPELQQSLTTELGRFHAYLKDEGIAAPSELPGVRMITGMQKKQGAIAYYDRKSNVMHIDPDFADDPDLILHGYSRHILECPILEGAGPRERDGEAIASGQASIVRGLAEYLLCSFRENPIPFRKTAARMGAAWRGVNLENRKKFHFGETSSSVVAMIDEQDVWAASFWNIRASLTAKIADPLLVNAWLQANNATVSKGFRQTFVELILALVARQCSDDAAGHIQEVLEMRGLKVSGRRG